MGIKVLDRFILASASPRRSELLKQLGLEFEVLPSGIDEIAQEGETPAGHVRRLAIAKAGELAGRHPEAWIIGADTIVVIDGDILGKPTTESEARGMLDKLSGRQHRVYTGIAVTRRSAAINLSEVVASEVIFKDLSREEIEWYVGTDEPYDKAGGYALQGRGAFFVKEIHGSYTNVIGLPLCETVNLLKLAGAIKFPGGNPGEAFEFLLNPAKSSFR
jgi:septum formation protein